MEKNSITQKYKLKLDQRLLERMSTSLSNDEFIDTVLSTPEFFNNPELHIEERELSLEERYNIWFSNNYETGMERFFSPDKLPDFDDEYYTSTPKKIITIQYNNLTYGKYK